jgi:choline-sulfatase
VTSNVSLLDLAPTLVDLAPGLASHDFNSFDGISLLPLLEGDAAGPNGVVAGEYLAEGALAPVVMMRRGKLKFISSPSDPDQLFDLETDPNELDNLAAASTHTREVAEFREEVTRRWNLPALQAEVLSSQHRRRLVAQALSAGAQASWDYTPNGAAVDVPYVRGVDFWAPFKRARIRRT